MLKTNLDVNNLRVILNDFFGKKYMPFAEKFDAQTAAIAYWSPQDVVSVFWFAG